MRRSGSLSPTKGTKAAPIVTPITSLYDLYHLVRPWTWTWLSYCADADAGAFLTLAFRFLPCCVRKYAERDDSGGLIGIRHSGLFKLLQDLELLVSGESGSPEQGRGRRDSG